EDDDEGDKNEVAATQSPEHARGGAIHSPKTQLFLFGRNEADRPRCRKGGLLSRLRWLIGERRDFPDRRWWAVPEEATRAAVAGGRLVFHSGIHGSPRDNRARPESSRIACSPAATFQ